MTRILQITTLLAFVAVLLSVLYMYSPVQNLGAAGALQSHIQSATSTTANPYTPITLFADQSSAVCHSRVVTTEQAIRISFDEVAGFSSTTLSATVGHSQAASTTVVYDAALYGCGWMTAKSVSATGTITISSF